MEMEKDAILCWVAGWADDPARAWALKSGARKNLIKKFKDNKISFQMAKSKIELSTPTKIPAEL